MSLIIRPVHINEIDFVNERYKEIHFKLSDPDHEYIVIAEYNGTKAGQGRLVKLNEQEAELGGMYVYPQFRGKGIAEQIVSHLLIEGKNFHRIYCLPFEHLEKFYKGFGFTDCTASVHKDIQAKYEWCLKEYPAKTLLLDIKN